MSYRWLVVCGGCILVAFFAFVPLEVPVAVAETASSDSIVPAQPVPRCVRGFSKDACKGRLDLTKSSQVFFVKCPDTELPGCTTLIGLGTSFSGSLNSSFGFCGNDIALNERCDEFPELGFFSAKLDLTLNSTFDDACRRRGNWRAEFVFADAPTSRAIIVAKGAGVLGVGSHRQGCQIATEPIPCDLEACENCLDTEFIPDPLNPEKGLWRIGLEGTINGEVVAGIQRGAEVTLMIQGDLFAPGTLAGGITDPTQGFDFCGTIDGVTVTFCP